MTKPKRKPLLIMVKKFGEIFGQAALWVVLSVVEMPLSMVGISMLTTTSILQTETTTQTAKAIMRNPFLLPMKKLRISLMRFSE